VILDLDDIRIGGANFFFKKSGSSTTPSSLMEQKVSDGRHGRELVEERRTTGDGRVLPGVTAAPVEHIPLWTFSGC
jgi:hypothetical protein